MVFLFLLYPVCHVKLWEHPSLHLIYKHHTISSSTGKEISWKEQESEFLRFRFLPEFPFPPLHSLSYHLMPSRTALLVQRLLSLIRWLAPRIHFIFSTTSIGKSYFASLVDFLLPGLLFLSGTLALTSSYLPTAIYFILLNLSMSSNQFFPLFLSFSHSAFLSFVALRFTCSPLPVALLVHVLLDVMRNRKERRVRKEYSVCVVCIKR